MSRVALKLANNSYDIHIGAGLLEEVGHLLITHDLRQRSIIITDETVNGLYGDALEALIGSLFLDKGFRKTKKLFIKRVLNRYLDIDKIIATDTDYKSLVFEWVQKNKANLIFEYNEEYDFNCKKSIFTTTRCV